MSRIGAGTGPRRRLAPTGAVKPKRERGRRSSPKGHATNRRNVEAARDRVGEDFGDLPRSPDLVEDDAPFEELGTDIPSGDEDDWHSGDDEEFDDHEPSNHASPSVSVDIAFSIGATGTVFEVRDFAVTGDEETDTAAQIESERLRRLAQAIRDLHPDALIAGSRREAFASLGQFTEPQARLARKAAEMDGERERDDDKGHHATWLSNNRHRLIAIRSGLVPLEFFWWRTVGTTDVVLDLWAEGYRERVADLAAARARVERRHGQKPDSSRRRHDKPLKLIREHWTVVREFQARWPSVTAEALAARLGETATSVAVQLAICGALDTPSEFEAPAQAWRRVTTTRHERVAT